MIMWSIVLASIPALVTAATEIIDFVNKIRAAAQQDGEWTPEAEAEWQKMLNAAKDQPQWQKDPE
jgi:hypothetical protein